MTTLWSRDREIQEIARKVPDPVPTFYEGGVWERDYKILAHSKLGIT